MWVLYKMLYVVLRQLMIKVHKDLSHLPKFKNAVITIGTFDGVHTGHQQIIQLLKKEATAIGGETVIITFYPHPRKVIHDGKKEIFVLNTLDEKIELLNNQGVEHLVVIPFDERFALQSAEAYVQDFLVAKFHPKTIIIGYDHKFGNNRSGDYHLLEKLGEKFNYNVKEIPGHMQNEITVSSTRIREALQTCRILDANTLLGYSYFFEGNVIKGNQLGRTIGYPTANISIEEKEKLIPGNGVYAVRVKIENDTTIYNGMMNIGIRPTLNGESTTTEVNLFNFSGDIYNKKIKVYIVNFIRTEVKFNNLEELKKQLFKDEETAFKMLA